MSLENKTNLVTQLQAVLQSTTQLEVALDAERKKNKKIAQEYIQVRTQLEEIAKKLKAENLKKDSDLKAQQKVIEGVRAHEKLLHEKAEKAAGELQIAKGVISEQGLINQQLQGKLAQLQAAQQRQLELERAVQALAQKNRELQQIHLDAQQEIQKAKLNFKTQYQTLLNQEAQKIKNSVQNEARAEVKKIKTLLDRNLKVEMDRMASNSQIEAQKAQDQINQANTELKIALQAVERYRSRFSDAQNEIDNHKSLVHQADQIVEKMELAYNESQAAVQELRTTIHEQDQTLSLLKLEKQKAETRAEEFIRDSSKTQLIERLKYETEIAALKSRLEKLEHTRVLIEKVEGPVDEPVLVAEPVRSEDLDQEIRH